MEHPIAALDISERVMDIVSRQQFCVTAADVSMGCGISLYEANRWLNYIAAKSQAVLEVTESGVVTYRFKPGFPGFHEFPLRRFAAELGQMCFTVILFTLKLALGLFILVTGILAYLAMTVVVIVTSIWSLFTGSGAGVDFTAVQCMFDPENLGMLFGGVSNVVGGDDGNRQSSSLLYPERESNRGFIYNTVQFLFGEGNPNRDLEDRKKIYIATMIRNNHGAIVEEQLAPFAWVEAGCDNDLFKTLVSYGGQPEVTETGNIVYVFPDIMQTAHEQIRADLPPQLVEQEWRFAGVPYDQLFPVYLFGGINMAIVCCLPFLWLTPYSLMAALFLALPTVRILFNAIQNSSIQMRNKYRQVYAEMLKDPDEDLAQKLNERKPYEQAPVRADRQPLEFTTDRDSEQQSERDTSFGP